MDLERKMYDFFISYSQEDSAIANQLYNEITGRGLTCFIDKVSIPAGMAFPTVISEAILQSDKFIFLGGKNSYESTFAISEVTFAVGNLPKGKVFPYLIDSQPMPASLQYLLASVNWRKMSDLPVDRFVDEVISGEHAPGPHFNPQFPPLTKALLMAYIAGFGVFAVAAFLMIVLPQTAWVDWPTILAFFCAIWGAISCYYILLKKKSGFWSLLPMALPVGAMWMTAPAANLIYAAIYMFGVIALFAILKFVKQDGHSGWDCLC